MPTQDDDQYPATPPEATASAYRFIFMPDSEVGGISPPSLDPAVEAARAGHYATISQTLALMKEIISTIEAKWPPSGEDILYDWVGTSDELSPEAARQVARLMECAVRCLDLTLLAWRSRQTVPSLALLEDRIKLNTVLSTTWEVISHLYDDTYHNYAGLKKASDDHLGSRD